MARKINLDYRIEGNQDLFDTVAKEWAEIIETAKCKNKKDRLVDMQTKKTQLRNFYDKVLDLENKAKKEDWEDVLPFVKMLNSKVAYAYTREVINCEFQNMMSQCIVQVQTKEDLTKFKLFFEAVLGFFKGNK